MAQHVITGKLEHEIEVIKADDEQKNYYNPKRWDTNKIVNKVEGIKQKLKTVTKHSKEWYILQLKREVAGSKKHIVNFEQLLDKYEKEK